MRAVVHDRYGSPDVLRVEEIERPIPKDDDVLIRIYAATVSRTDCGLRSADLFVSRLVTGLLRPSGGSSAAIWPEEVSSISRVRRSAGEAVICLASSRPF